MEANKEYSPFPFPNTFPSNNSFFILTVTDERELIEELKKHNKEEVKDWYVIHSGPFHCDEVMATIILKYAKLALPSGIIIRTRDEEIIKKGKIVYDIGGISNAKSLRFDHHMKDFKETFDANHDIKLSSCGLVYKYFGKEAVKNILAEWKIVDEKCVEYTYSKVYEDLIMTIDAMDNGINQYPFNIDPRYRINTHLGSRVSRCNPAWNAENGNEMVNIGFKGALKVCEEELLWQLYSQACVLYPAFAIVEKGYKERTKFHPSGQLLYLETACPWGQQLRTLEEADTDPNKKPVLFIIAKNDKEHRVQCIPEKPGNFVCRLYLCEKWRGLRGEELIQASGIPGSVFVHASGYLGIGTSFETVIKMAELSMAEGDSKMTDEV